MPTTRNISQYRYSTSIDRRYWNQDYLFDDFKVNPMTSSVAGGAASGADGAVNVMLTAFGEYQWNVMADMDGQTTIAPSLDDFGLNIALTDTETDGLEICIGQNSISPIQFTIGEQPAFFMTFSFKIGTATGVDPGIIGFRKVQAFDSDISNYTDFVAIGLVGGAGEIQTETQLNSGGVITTDVNVSIDDGDVTTLTINIDSAGLVTYQVNYQDVVSAVFNFDNGDVVIPFIRMNQSADTTTQFSTNYLEVGFQT